MNCRQADERLQDLLDSRTNLKSDDQLQSHLNECADCRRMAEEYATLFGMDTESDLLSVASLSRCSESRSNDGSVGWKVFRSLTVIAGVFVLVVMPAMWGARESIQLSSRNFAVAQPVERTDEQNEVPVLADEFSRDSDINVASVLDIGSAFNSFSLNATEVDSEVNMESTDSENLLEMDSRMNSVGRMLTSFIPGKSLSQNDMPGEAKAMEMMPGNSVMSDLMQPIHFEQPTLKGLLRVCTNPFSQS